ncbi:uncharacterized protein N7446_009185 [Penicillium canescens]|uniref:Uncharacterized protein n=1 Tax=Penicillium canescens TaxID=5083 RepID=A0AAD6N5G7_PENCN|nr:uncharacterized protein N7446_009185 [Penicillium canescens]KAJ6034435.1 hypothetical protein N7460_008610 [Penicillium canescens]KAJ6046094.1 hypothetical protein N7444_007348 [Penicillium canescens]KAJ6053173.1 hypothetical protein N7446_009185 [Penicillium canescens]
MASYSTTEQSRGIIQLQKLGIPSGIKFPHSADRLTSLVVDLSEPPGNPTCTSLKADKKGAND